MIFDGLVVKLGVSEMYGLPTQLATLVFIGNVRLFMCN